MNPEEEPLNEIVGAENEMGTAPVGRLLRKMAVPLVFSMLIQVLYGLISRCQRVHRFTIGNAPC